MGRVDYEDALLAARRYARARQQQETSSSAEADARMLNRRRDFLRPDDRVFFESIIEGSDILPMRYLAIGQLAARAVGRLQVPSQDRRGLGFATGFLVAPNLLLTNQHVLRTAAWAEAAMLTMDAEDGPDGTPLAPRVFRLRPDDVYVADEGLDFCFVSVRPRAVDGSPLAAYGYLRLFEQTGKIVRDEYASIVQHPNGRQKHLAARNNRVTVYVYDEDLSAEGRPDNDFLYYETDTLRGSSGSPVFSDQWYVAALHRRGVPAVATRGGTSVILRRDGRPARDSDDEDTIRYVSNEGVRISRVLARLRLVAADDKDPQREAARVALTAIEAAAGEVGQGPVATPVAVPMVLQPRGRPGVRMFGGMGPAGRSEGGLLVAGLVPEGLEIVRRPMDAFPDDRGYDPDFLRGVTIPLPRPKAALRKALAPRLDRPGEYLLPFRHFTTAMHARRRLPVFSAVNIDGARAPEGALGPRPSWSYDPRIAEEHQPDDSIFSSLLQRGHLAAREHVVWGRTPGERREADVHSFTLTNVCPQIRAFNAAREWYRVERQVARGAEDEARQVTVFVGPILSADDPLYDRLRGDGSTAEFYTRIRIPLRFWKIIAWVENGTLQYRAFLLDQSDELYDAGPLEMDIETPEGVEDSSVEEIAELTDLEFEGF